MSANMYAPLPEGHVRTLRIAPGEFGSPLFAELEVVFLDTLRLERESAECKDEGEEENYKRANHGAFEAISYAWESTERVRSICLPSNASFGLTESLYQALQHFRYPDRPRKLWADAICINQDDLVERGSQVAIMADIFDTAWFVLVWLGPAQPSDALAFAVLDPVIRNKIYPGTNTVMISNDDLQCSCCSEAFPAPKDPLTAFEAVKHLLDRPWFSRLWVLQETAVSPRRMEMCSGFHCISATDSFLHLKLWLKEFQLVDWLPVRHAGWHDSGDRAAVSWFDLRGLWPNLPRDNKDGGSERLADCLIQSRRRRCLDPRDRIFALRRVLGIEHNSTLLPDYSLTTQEVYRRAAIATLQAGQRVSQTANRHGSSETSRLAALILGIAGTDASSSTADILPDRPSWVPNFCALGPRSEIKRVAYCDATLAQCFGQIKIRSQDHERNVLGIAGYCYGAIESVLLTSAYPRRSPEEEVLDYQIPWDTTRSLIDWYYDCRAFLNACGLICNPEDLTDILRAGAFRRTHEKLHKVASRLYKRISSLVRDGYGGENKHTKTRPTIARARKIRELVSSLLAHHSKPKATKTRRGKKALHNPAADFQLPMDLRLFENRDARDRHDYARILCTIKTKEGATRAGWVPPDAQVGDVVALFSGMPFPMILRRRIEQDGFQLLGDAWFYNRGASRRPKKGHNTFGFDPQQCQDHREGKVQYEWIDLY